MKRDYSCAINYLFNQGDVAIYGAASPLTKVGFMDQTII